MSQFLTESDKLKAFKILETMEESKKDIGRKNNVLYNKIKNKATALNEDIGGVAIDAINGLAMLGGAGVGLAMLYGGFLVGRKKIRDMKMAWDRAKQEVEMREYIKRTKEKFKIELEKAIKDLTINPTIQEALVSGDNKKINTAIKEVIDPELYQALIKLNPEGGAMGGQAKTTLALRRGLQGQDEEISDEIEDEEDIAEYGEGGMDIMSAINNIEKRKKSREDYDDEMPKDDYED